MRHVITILFAAGLLSGMVIADDGTKKSEKKLVETWKGKLSLDEKELRKHAPFSGMTDKEFRKVALGLRILTKSGSQTLEFHSDGTATNRLSRLGIKKEKKGTWKVLSQKKSMITVEMTVGKTGEKTKFQFEIVDKNSMKLMMRGGPTKGFTHLFKRVEKKKEKNPKLD